MIGEATIQRTRHRFSPRIDGGKDDAPVALPLNQLAQTPPLGQSTMPKRTHASVTQRRCACGTLERYAAQEDMPIVFEKRTNEFRFKYPTEHGDGEIIIYHCPFCGGTTPKSTRDKLFAVISVTEAHRLNNLCADIGTIEEAIKTFGLPDQDFRGGTGIHQDEKDSDPPTTTFFRRIVYTNLSETAEVHLTDYNRERVGVEAPNAIKMG